MAESACDADDAVDDGVDNGADRRDCEDLADESELVEVLHASTGLILDMLRPVEASSNSSETGVPGRLPTREALRLVLAPLAIRWLAWATSLSSSTMSSRTIAFLGDRSVMGGLACGDNGKSPSVRATAASTSEEDVADLAVEKTSSAS